MSVTTIHQSAPSPMAVTVQHDFCNATADGEKLFSVRGGIPLADAFDQLTLLLAQGQSAIEGVCIACSSEEIPEAPHAALRLVEFSAALVMAMHKGLIAHETALNSLHRQAPEV